MTCAHVYFKGMVQGVGFRYTCRNYAVELGIHGNVRNLPDGRVELWAQSSKDKIEQLLAKLKDHFGGYIHAIQVDYAPADVGYLDFQIIV